MLGIVLGLPALFLAIGASPIPDQTPTLDGIKNALLAPDDGTLVLGLFKVIGWVAWAFMALSLVVEAIARLRKVQAPQLPGLGRPQAAARGLIGLAALLFIAAPIAAQASTISSAAAAAGGGGTRHAPVPSTRRPPSRTSRSTTKQERQRKTVDHAVRPGESLWSIAEDHFGDGARYKELVELNRDLLGAQPSFLEPGWVLKLPAPDGGAPAHDYTVQPTDTLSEIAQEQLGDADRWPEIYQASTGITQPGGAHLDRPRRHRRRLEAQHPRHRGSRPATTTRGTVSRARTSPRRPPSPRTSRPVDPPAEEEPPVDPEPEAPRPPRPRSQPPQAEEPSAPAADVDQVDDADDSILDAPWVLAGLTGGGVLLSGALLMALRSRRRAGYRNRPPGRAIAAPPPELAPVEMTLNATGAAAAATVEFADEALRRLAAAVGAAGHHDAAARGRGARATAS